MLCNEVCPRDEAGIMLVERSLGAERRPPWYIAKIMHELDREFDAVSELRDVSRESHHLHIRDCGTLYALTLYDRRRMVEHEPRFKRVEEACNVEGI
jgi:hypothetical protein